MFSATLIFFNFGVTLLDDDEAVLDFRSVLDPALDRFLAGLSCGTFRSKVLTCGKYLQFFDLMLIMGNNYTLGPDTVF